MESIIFLDIDGVLVTTRGTDYWLKTKCDIFEDNSCYELFCPNSVEALNKLIRLTDSKIVVISSWRRTLTLSQIREKFKSRGVKGEILGVTPYLNDEIERGREIELWMQKNGTPKSYVIIDDDCDVDIMDKYFPNDRCVQTSVALGIAGKYSYKRAISILNKPVEVKKPKKDTTKTKLF